MEKISRQLAWRRRKQAAGCCVQCGLPRGKQHKSLCRSCRRKNQIRLRRRYYSRLNEDRRAS